MSSTGSLLLSILLAFLVSYCVHAQPTSTATNNDLYRDALCKAESDNGNQTKKKCHALDEAHGLVPGQPPAYRTDFVFVENGDGPRGRFFVRNIAYEGGLKLAVQKIGRTETEGEPADGGWQLVAVPVPSDTKGRVDLVDTFELDGTFPTAFRLKVTLPASTSPSAPPSLPKLLFVGQQASEDVIGLTATSDQAILFTYGSNNSTGPTNGGGHSNGGGGMAAAIGVGILTSLMATFSHASILLKS